VGSKEPRSVTETDLKSFLSHLAVERKVAAATQKLAFNALLFLFRNVLAVEIRGLENVVPSHVPRRLPVVLTMEEVKKVFACMGGTTRLMAVLIYGSGLRLQECLSLRIKDVDFGRACLTVRGGKGDKDRQTVLPQHNTLLGVPKIEAALCVSAFRKESASSRLLGDNTQT
jgi:site-specific recombinase XerD